MQETKEKGLIPGLGRPPGGGNSNALQYSHLEDSMDRDAGWAYIPGGYKVLNMTEHSID